MKRPRLLDLFCGAGGSAVGYHRAGFDVVGVDHEPQPRYPFEYVQADALDLLKQLIAASCDWTNMSGIGGIDLFDISVIHASPPCQVYSAAKRIGNARPGHQDLVGKTLALLEQTGKLWVVENVPGAPLTFPAILCGTQFGLPLRRHRLFVSNTMLFSPNYACRHQDGDYTVFGHAVQLCGSKGTVYKDASGRTHYRQKRRPFKEGCEAMGIDWMNRAELSQAIPPAYTEWIGRQLLSVLAAKHVECGRLTDE